MKINHFLKKIFKPKIKKTNRSKESSVVIIDQKVIDLFSENPDHTFLVSFPRTGSHWLRMIMELYFGRPSLVRVFYYPERTDYLTRHVHDLDLTLERPRVIYLYRNPVDTIYSQLQYEKDDLNDREKINHWTELYGKHLDKWLCRERFTTHKTVIRYEGMKKNLVAEFAKVTSHFQHSLARDRLSQAVERVTKPEVERKTRDDPQVLQLGKHYEQERRVFRERHAKFIWQVLSKHRAHLMKFFDLNSSQ